MPVILTLPPEVIHACPRWVRTLHSSGCSANDGMLIPVRGTAFININVIIFYLLTEV